MNNTYRSYGCGYDANYNKRCKAERKQNFQKFLDKKCKKTN